MSGTNGVGMFYWYSAKAPAKYGADPALCAIILETLQLCRRLRSAVVSERRTKRIFSYELDTLYLAQ